MLAMLSRVGISKSALATVITLRQSSKTLRSFGIILGGKVFPNVEMKILAKILAK
jgi:hypothetical protein